MVGKLTIAGMQQYLKEKDFAPDHKMDYFLKLIEETGELAEAIYRGRTPATEEQFKGTIEEELFDILYYTLCLANVYDIDLEKWAFVKECLNDAKYGTHDADKLINGI